MITKESAAWLALAEEHAGNDKDGLCASLRRLDNVAWEVRYVLADRIDEEVWMRHNSEAAVQERASTVWAYSPSLPIDKDMTDSEKREARVLAALMFSHEAKSEGR